MPSELDRAITRARRAIETDEAPIRRTLQRVYQQAIDELTVDLNAMTRQIAQARAEGVDVNPDWLRRQARYRQLLADVEVQFLRFSGDGLRILREGRLRAIRGGAVQAWDLMDAAGFEIGFGGRVNTGAVERAVAALSDESPLRRVLDGYGTRAATVIEETLLRGIVQGTAPRELVRQLRRQLLDAVTQARLDSLVRTEMMRAFRGSLNAQYAEMAHLIAGYRWSCAKGIRTCLACLAMDGHVQKTPHDRFHIRCRCIDSPVPIGVSVPYETGPQWFARQPARIQRTMLPSPAAYDAFGRGELTLEHFVGTTQSRVWGTSVVELSGRLALERVA
jgi:SPP1 gp7 family putative phage head morphogenesis protein